jgi:hypothetical protein
MFATRWSLVLLFSASAFGVTFEEKELRFKELEALSKTSSVLNLDSYRRTLQYESKNLPLNERSKLEANFLLEKMKLQISKTFEASLDELGAEGAFEETKLAIERDTELMGPKISGIMKELSLQYLESVRRGVLNPTLDTGLLEDQFSQQVREQFDFYNVDHSRAHLNNALNFATLTSNSKNFGRGDVVSALVSPEAGVDAPGSNLTNISTANRSMNDRNISLQLKVEFLGSFIEAGPSITFRRSYHTQANLIAEGMSPVLLPSGQINFALKDPKGKVLSKKRLVTFNCETSLVFESDYSGRGGFALMGAGATAGVSKSYASQVSLNSRRMLVPETIDGKLTRFQDLSDICHSEFLNARLSDNLKVSESLNIMMKSAVSSIVFTHPKNSCATDVTCAPWFQKEIAPLVRAVTYPRCSEDPKEKFRACELRSLEGQNCPIFKNGKRVSSGAFEYACDQGLKCVQSKAQGLLSPAVGKCVVINPKTYRKPTLLPVQLK